MPRKNIWKVDVTYENDAHPPQRVAVHNPKKIKSEADAVSHCLTTLHHKDEEGEIHKCKTAVAVPGGPFSEENAPRIQSIDQAPLAPAEAAAQAMSLPADPRANPNRDDGQ